MPEVDKRTIIQDRNGSSKRTNVAEHVTAFWTVSRRMQDSHNKKSLHVKHG